MVFTRYLEHSKGYVMHGEHSNGGMIEVDSCIIEDGFPSVGEIKKDLALYELPLDDQLSPGEGVNLNTHLVTKDSTISFYGRDDEMLMTQKN